MSKWKLKPAAGKVVVRVEDAEKISEGGIIIPPTAVNEKPTVGKVTEVCESYWLDDQEMQPLFKPGDVVVFGRYTGTAVTIEREKYVILKEQDVLGWVVELTDDGQVLREVGVMPKIRTEGRK